ncbi:MerR family transcriptional regulator [Anaerocolumna cellulosilytica]|uniref:MerR family transcriptional regulator n=1 Tax=Anaerocolumna cellulosilytica TaxID=433286 RepID=A0A6S6R3U4_9FIRM|nr:MerR family transcriptional regulator [Anaerocolumna cellulosilytica]MBB5195984.1 DNA-binding transcriptional MerR regulator [Anaerocolumna cellulosilytica]BCJ93718.1 MerR family transcriptional regulator [Anaerocolumna cellulosilytica]
MEYTVQKLARLAGVSPRTLRYYDELGLLKPARINSSGYRIYGKPEVNLLQQILFYRELGVSLDGIKDIITTPSFNSLAALKEHHKKLLAKKKQLELLIINVEKTIVSTEGRITMSDNEKFKGFKQNLIAENEAAYGVEIREKYGEEAINQSNQKLMNLTEEQYNQVKALEEDLFQTLSAAYETGNPAGALAQKAANLHKQWLCFFWEQYSPEAHAGLAQMYVADERFKAYYDKAQSGTTEFLKDAILNFTKTNR